MSQKRSNIDITLLIFILVIVADVIFGVRAFEGLLFSDDYSYASYAFQCLQGTFDLRLNDIFAHRPGVFLPVSLLYYLFGVNDITTALWPFLCFIATTFIIWMMLHKENKTACIAAMLLSSLNFYPMLFSCKLFPDVIVSFFALLTSYHLMKRTRESQIQRSLWCSFTFFYGFLCKETILYILPWMGALLIYDIIHKKHYLFWLGMLLTMLLIFTLYFTLYNHFTGDPFYRFYVIQEGHYETGYSYYDKSWSLLLDRMTLQPFLMLINTEIGIPVLLGLPLLCCLRNCKAQEAYWVLTAIFVLLTFWWGTTSLRFYNPIALNGRMFIMIVPFWSIAAGYAFSKALKEQRWYLKLYALLLLLFAVIAFYTFQNYKEAMLYLLLALLMILIYVQKGNTYSGNILMATLALLLLVHPVYSMMKSSDANYDGLKKIMNARLIHRRGEVILISDILVRHAYPYLYRFHPPGNLHVYSFREARLHDLARAEEVYVLISKRNLDELALNNAALPVAHLPENKNWELVDAIHDVMLYRVRNLSDIHSSISKVE